MSSLEWHHILTVHPSVAVRPEPFGALLYHFGTRRLSFLKDRTLVAIVQSCDGQRSLSDACERAGVAAEHQDRYLRAVSTLVDSRMLVESTRVMDAVE